MPTRPRMNRHRSMRICAALIAPIAAGCLETELALTSDEQAISRYDENYIAYLDRFGFQTSIVEHGFEPYSAEKPQLKEVPLLLVLAQRAPANADGGCSEPFSRPIAEIEEIAFGGGMPSVRNYFLENSHRRLTYVRAGMVTVCGLPSEAWFHHGGDAPGDDVQELLVAAIVAAASHYPIMDHDRDGDGIVEPEELTILVLDEWDYSPDDGGGARDVCTPLPAGGRYCGYAAGAGAWGSLFTWAHELSHTLGTEDLYWNGANFVSTLLAAGTTPPRIMHLDAWHKLRLGWLRPELIDVRAKSSDERLLYCAGDPRAEVDGALLFHNPDRGTDEYFLVEARCKRDHDDGTLTAGVATWQVRQQASSYGSEARFNLPRDYPAKPAQSKACTTIAGGVRCDGPSVCLHDTRADNRDICYHQRFLAERGPLVKPMSLQWADGTWADVDLRTTPVFEYVDYGIPGYRHVEVQVGYRVAWTPRVE
jgi:M6 family metalloprotease-like protein